MSELARDKGHTDLAKGQYALSQVLQNLSLEQVKPCGSNVLIKDLPDDDKIGSIVIPENHKSELRRIGIVVAVGPGDKWIQGRPKIKGTSKPTYRALPEGTERLEMECKPGDRVLFDRRRHREIYIEGERYSLVYEAQSVLAILED